jgi:hypothetical protein
MDCVFRFVALRRGHTEIVTARVETAKLRHVVREKGSQR